ncbi:MAG TPA: Glu/Leu/Phe/Val dehydrogenase dimerization domain-containing protein [Nitrospinota bacterium]|nr:Glu/Leu/Phe/Val dehydrogenase dimerization domain-containing protein [Nitrospinota bacterium]
MREEKNRSFFENSIINKMPENEHEEVVFCEDNQTGLKAIIAVHNTVLGPSLGGVRMWHYKNGLEGTRDALKLSKAMTYKASIAGLNLGGGKAVIIDNSIKNKSPELFRRFGQFIESLNGKYITAKDVGTSSNDMKYIKMETNHVTCLPESSGGGGDPSSKTAHGVYMGMKACAKLCYGKNSLENKVIVVQGVGYVGMHLVEWLVKENAKVFISDIDEEKVKEVVKKYNVKSVGLDEVYDTEMDIYSPCALGATVNDNTLSRLKCSIIAGGANNQLAEENVHGRMVMEKGIIYAPDFVINAGGLINCYSEVIGYNREYVHDKVENIHNTILDILKKSKKENSPANLVAKKIAKKRIEEARK